VQEAVATKTVLLLFYIVICMVLFLVGFFQIEQLALFSLMAIAAVFMSLGDFYNVPFRAIQKFHKESLNVICASVIHFSIVTPAVLIYRTGIAVAWSFVISRLLYLLISLYAYKKEFGSIGWSRTLFFNRRIIQSNIKESFSYAADNGLVNVRSYMDVVVINWSLGNVAVGLYQAGMNIVKAIENLAPIFANVYLPKLSQLKENIKECNHHYLHLVSMMFGGGLVLFLMFLLANKDVIIFVLGDKYAGTTYLFPLFGIFLFARFMTISQGVVATAFGLQRYRMYAGVISLILLIVASVTLIKVYGISGAVMANIIVTIFLLVYFAVLLHMKKVRLSAGVFSMLLFALFMVILTLYFSKV